MQRLPDEVRRALELRALISRASTAKIEAIIKRAESDSRIRSTLMYHGAHTGRWSGMGVQPQNLPRGDKYIDHREIDDVVELYRKEGTAAIIDIYDDPMLVASSLIRSLLCAAPRHTLVCADYSSIEGRVLAWLAGEDWVTRGYEQNLDPYIVAASSIYNVSYDDVTPAQRQIGKVADLACGFQGGKGAFARFAEAYGLDLPESQAVDIIEAWRISRPNIVDFWRNMERCFMEAIRHPGKTQGYRGIKMKRNEKGYLRIRLPSGRLLWYPNALLEWKASKFGQNRKVQKCTYFGKDPYTNKFKQVETYGGKLTENVVQAVARDLLSSAVVRLQEHGYKIVMLVHDEVVAEARQTNANLDEMIEIMCNSPEWADGLPVAAAGWVGKRYRKD